MEQGQDVEDTWPKGIGGVVGMSSSSQSFSTDLDVEETMPVGGQFSPGGSCENLMSSLEEDLARELSENYSSKCKVAGHKKEDLTFVCTFSGCEQILLCKKCKKKHDRTHAKSVRVLDQWFNNMFGRRVEDSDNNKVSRKCGMNVGKLPDLISSLQDSINQRKAVIEKQTTIFLEHIAAFVKQKSNECIGRLDAIVESKLAILEEHQQTYKRLKSMNRFTILENLKRQHDPSSQLPPTIPIDSIIRFLISNEERLADSQQIEEQHKHFSKLLRDTESLEQNLNNEKKNIQKLVGLEQNSEDYLVRDSPILQRIHDYIDFLYSFEKGLPKKSGLPRWNTNSNEEEKSVHLTDSQRFRRRLTIEEVLEHNKSNSVNAGGISTSINSAMMPPPQSNADILMQRLQLQDEGEYLSKRFIRIKTEEDERKNTIEDSCDLLSESEDEQESEYECVAQENFNTASFIDFSGGDMRVFADSVVSVFDIESRSDFNKRDSIKAKQQIASDTSTEQDMYEIGAIEIVDFFTAAEPATLNSPTNSMKTEFVSFNQLDWIDAEEESKQQSPQNQTATATTTTATTTSSSSSEQCAPVKQIKSTASAVGGGTSNSSKQQQNLEQQRILIIGLKTDPAKIDIFEMKQNKRLCEFFSAHECSITCVQIIEVVNNDHITFATGSYDGTIKTWMFSKVVSQNSQPLSDQILPVVSDESPVGSVTAGTAGNPSNSTIITYKIVPQLTMKCHTDFVTSMIMFKLKDDLSKEYLISSSSDKKIALWDWRIQKPEINTISISNLPLVEEQQQTQQQQQQQTPNQLDSSQEVAGGANSTPPKEQKSSEEKKKPLFLKKQVRLLKVKTDENRNTQQQSGSNSSSSSSNALLSNASSGKTGVEISKQQQQMDQNELRKPLKTMSNVHLDKINCFERLEEGYLASGSSDGTIKLWDMDILKESKVLQNKFIVNSICRLKRGFLACSANNVKMSTYLVNIWNWERGQVSQVIKGHTARITKVYALESNNTILTCERNKVIRIWRQPEPLFPKESKLQNSTLLSASQRITDSKRYSFRNPAEEFLQNYHIELDPSLTPKCVNLARLSAPSNSFNSNNNNNGNYGFVGQYNVYESTPIVSQLHQSQSTPIHFAQRSSNLRRSNSPLSFSNFHTHQLGISSFHPSQSIDLTNSDDSRKPSTQEILSELSSIAHFTTSQHGGGGSSGSTKRSFQIASHALTPLEEANESNNNSPIDRDLQRQTRENNLRSIESFSSDLQAYCRNPPSTPPENSQNHFTKAYSISPLYRSDEKDISNSNENTNNNHYYNDDKLKEIPKFGGSSPAIAPAATTISATAAAAQIPLINGLGFNSDVSQSAPEDPSISTVVAAAAGGTRMRPLIRKEGRVKNLSRHSEELEKFASSSYQQNDEEKKEANDDNDGNVARNNSSSSSSGVVIPPPISFSAPNSPAAVQSTPLKSRMMLSKQSKGSRNIFSNNNQ